MVEEAEVKIEVPVALVKESCGKVLIDVVVAVKKLATTCPNTESGAYGDVVPMPMLPVKYPIFVLGSNQYFAVVVEFVPIATTSVLLFE